MSNERMRGHHRSSWFLVIIGILLAPFLAVHVQEMIFRHRAEQLLTDIRALMSHKANLREMQAEFNRWDPHGEPCSDQSCSLEGDSWSSGFVLYRVVNPEEVETDWRRLWIPPLFRTFGGRISHVGASFQTTYFGRLIMFEVDMETSPGSGVNDYHAKNVLSGAVVSSMWFCVHDDWQGLTLHPNYVIGGVYPNTWYPPWATSTYVAFGPHATAADIARLASFDLSCLTRLEPCHDQSELMPEAAAQHAKEEFQLARSRNDHVCGPEIVRLMARDAAYAGLVAVTAIHTEEHFDEDSVPIPTALMIHNFKPASDWENGGIRNLEFVDVNTGHSLSTLPAEVYTGNRLIILAQPEKHHGITVDRCGAMPLTPGNLEIVRHAIWENLLPTNP